VVAAAKRVIDFRGATRSLRAANVTQL